MGSFVFTWPNAAEEVYVTGTFDGWSKSAKLEKVDGIFQKAVQLEDASSKIYYKFVVDGEWVVDTAAPNEKDESGNINNVLTPENIVASIPAAVLISAAPTSTTSDLAKDVPLEETADPVFSTPVISEPVVINPSTIGSEAIFITSAAPTSTTADLLKDVPFENKAEPVASVETAAPIATGAPLELTEPAVSAATISSAAPESTTAALAKDVPLEEPVAEKTAELPAELNKEIKLINPFPAAPGGINPVKLAPGEPIPESLKTADINANVKLDPESYEKADAAIAGDYSATSLPPVSKNMIPESSLPIASGNDFHINSAAPVATTAALAGAVPLEKKAVDSTSAPVETATVPDVVKESQKEAGVAPEASAIPEEVKEKEQVEEELLKKVPEAPATSEGTTSGTVTAAGIVGGITAAAAGLGAAAYATATSAKDKAVEQGTPALEQAAANLPLSVKQVLPAAVQEKIAAASATGGEAVTTDIPAEVKESFQESGFSPEAAANKEAVDEKKAVESELLKKIAPVESASEPSAPTATSSFATSAPVPVPAAESAAASGPGAAYVAAPTGLNGSEPAYTASPTSVPAVVPAAPGSPVAAHSTIPAAVSSSAPGTSAPSSTGEKKKKNRISSFFHKVFDSKKK
ncbi:carbohydrate-binding module family 48 protein [Ophiostoma piceae UAMH 11346]|uniref:Carbohydrate-binding module family 48 protein n=1 Tax=Ophiostoma piceae (strain UAMH 11346) TaxID=1262450 RepID=S3C8G7_OPHP1|nr:carbohydrate-binding module family 48 protein [Ophiostoma piceae UAMH 11346]